MNVIRMYSVLNLIWTDLPYTFAQNMYPFILEPLSRPGAGTALSLELKSDFHSICRE
jgi:hypothetical protein